MRIRLRESRLHVLDLTTRIPFRYGIATMTEVPHLMCQAVIEIDGETATGQSADHLPPRWFTKDPRQTPAQEIAVMVSVIERAFQIAAELPADSLFSWWEEFSLALRNWGKSHSYPPLLTQFADSLVERCIWSALCHRLKCSLFELLNQNRLPFQPGHWSDDFRHLSWQQILPQQPTPRLRIRQTIGLTDPLGEADVADENRLNDGLPESIEQAIQTGRLDHFKMKIAGDSATDLERLRELHALLETECRNGYAFTLDGNEQFTTLEEFQTHWRRLNDDPQLKPFWSHLLFVEQPFHREIALDENALQGLSVWKECPALIIDESDADSESFSQAVSLGYRGTSHKNCKGIRKSLRNACRLHRLREQYPETTWIQSGEDLVNVGPIALLQDCAMVACLGLTHAERNGHHYFAGLSQFPQSLQTSVQTHHADLYRQTEHGWPALHIVDGSLSLQSVNNGRFGLTELLDLSDVPELTEWKKNSPLAVDVV